MAACNQSVSHERTKPHTWHIVSLLVKVYIFDNFRLHTELIKHAGGWRKVITQPAHTIHNRDFSLERLVFEVITRMLSIIFHALRARRVRRNAAAVRRAVGYAREITGAHTVELWRAAASERAHNAGGRPERTKQRAHNAQRSARCERVSPHAHTVNKDSGRVRCMAGKRARQQGTRPWGSVGVRFLHSFDRT